MYLQRNAENASGDRLQLAASPSGRMYPLSQTLNFQISDDVMAELEELNSRGIDVNELLREMLQRRREEIAETKEKISMEARPTSSRYIPVKIKKILKKEYGEKCSIATCQKLAEEIHHAQRFGLSQNHDPRFLAPLCRDHHVIAHSIDVKFHEARIEAIP